MREARLWVGASWEGDVVVVVGFVLVLREMEFSSVFVPIVRNMLIY